MWFYLFLTALIITTIAAIWDIKTTEIPDVLPFSLAILGIGYHLYLSLTVGNFTYLYASLVAGSIGFIIGYLLYYFGQWGAGDSALLVGLGFCFPEWFLDLKNMPLVYVFNLFIVGFVYMVIYALVMAALNKKILKRFFVELKNKMPSLVVLFIILVFWCLTISYYYNLLIYLATTILLVSSVFFSLFFIWILAKSVEEVGFKKRIPVSKLKVGDVLLKYKRWVGVTEEELKKIKRLGKKYVWIKEGVRFAPAFPLALLTTWLLGDIVTLVFYLIISLYGL